MGFDEEVDQLKRELQTPKLDSAGIKEATVALHGKLKDKIQSRRLEFTVDDGSEPSIAIVHTPSKERLATININEDGSVTFQSPLGDEQSEADFDNGGYFPPYVEYYDEEEFLEEAPEMLKQGIAEFELDQEEAD
jgi:hypothetical protein